MFLFKVVGVDLFEHKNRLHASLEEGTIIYFEFFKKH